MDDVVIVSVNIFIQHQHGRQEAQLSQRDRAMFVTLISISHSRSLKVIKDGAIRQTTYDLLIVCHSCIISEIKRDIGRKSRLFIPSLSLHSASQLGGGASEYCHRVWYGKLDWCGYRKKFEDMFSRFDRIPACDGRTDRQ